MFTISTSLRSTHSNSTYLPNDDLQKDPYPTRSASLRAPFRPLFQLIKSLCPGPLSYDFPEPPSHLHHLLPFGLPFHMPPANSIILPSIAHVNPVEFNNYPLPSFLLQHIFPASPRNLLELISSTHPPIDQFIAPGKIAFTFISTSNFSSSSQQSLSY